MKSVGPLQKVEEVDGLSREAGLARPAQHVMPQEEVVSGVAARGGMEISDGEGYGGRNGAGGGGLHGGGTVEGRIGAGGCAVECCLRRMNAVRGLTAVRPCRVIFMLAIRDSPAQWSAICLF